MNFIFRAALSRTSSRRSRARTLLAASPSPRRWRGYTSTVRARWGRLSALSVFLCESFFYGGFVWEHRALNSQKRWFPAWAVASNFASFFTGENIMIDGGYSSTA